MLYLSLLVGLPVAALVATAATGSFWSTVTAPHTRAALEFTVGVALGRRRHRRDHRCRSGLGPGP